MVTTDRFYGGSGLSAGRTIQDFGLCDLKGEFVYTARVRPKGMLVVTFFAPDSPPSVSALQRVQAWTEALPTQKWTTLAVTEGDRAALKTFADRIGLTGASILVDHELYQTRQWGVSHLPSTYLISGKTGRVLLRVLGDDAAGLEQIRATLTDEVNKIVAAEEAAKKAEEEKKAAEAAAKAAEDAKKAEEAKKA